MCNSFFFFALTFNNLHSSLLSLLSNGDYDGDMPLIYFAKEIQDITTRDANILVSVAGDTTKVEDNLEVYLLLLSRI